MNINDVIRAWRDPLFRSSLSADERAQLPANPAGMIELSGTVLDAVAGGCETCEDRSENSRRSSGSGNSSCSGRSTGGSTNGSNSGS